jgi:hypothetical protein
MHHLNDPSYITNEFFSKPGSIGQVRLEHIYNRIYGVIPTTLKCSEIYEETCVPSISENFDIMYSEMTSAPGKMLEELILVGKKGTVYARIILALSHSGSDGEFNFRGEAVSTLIADAIAEKRSVDIHIKVSAALEDRSQAKLILNLLEPYKHTKKSKIYMLANSYGDLTFNALPLPPVETNLALNYGEDFLKFHETLVDSVNNKQSGLYLFYGPPGTGKSSYIKHLLAGEIKRKMAYIPVGMINQLVSPDMLPLLTDNKDIVLVLEDAEKALISRDVAENAAVVSTILNLTDGFVGQALNITVIATFNTDREKIDAALLRKGRLRLSYEFGKLNVKDGKKLAEAIGLDSNKIRKEMTLADIYNFEEETGYEEPEQRRVGFN